VPLAQAWLVGPESPVCTSQGRAVTDLPWSREGSWDQASGPPQALYFLSFPGLNPTILPHPKEAAEAGCILPAPRVDME
jgi:hypothetical protein